MCAGAPICPDTVPGAQEGMSSLTAVLKGLMGLPYIGDGISFALCSGGSVDQAATTMAAAPDCAAALERGRREHPELTKGVVEAMTHGTGFTYAGTPLGNRDSARGR